MKRAQSEPAKSNLVPWLHVARGARDRIERLTPSVALSTDRLIADSTDRLVTSCHLGLNIHLSRNRTSERKSKCKERNEHVDSSGYDSGALRVLAKTKQI
jgi:hypothetical protein